MENRIIKFRFWLGHTKKMTYAHPLQEVGKVVPEFTEDIIPLQWTGLKDKNGTEIYEGDILSFDYADSTSFKEWMKAPCYKVEYECGYDVCGSGLKEKLFLHGFRFKHTEVLGNIFTNPELLTA